MLMDEMSVSTINSWLLLFVCLFVCRHYCWYTASGQLFVLFENLFSFGRFFVAKEVVFCLAIIFVCQCDFICSRKELNWLFLKLVPGSLLWHFECL